jgi:uncharacterized protein (DUF1778 family)
MTPDGPRISMNIRITDAERDRIDHAARIDGGTRSAFMLAAALEKAEVVILDRVHFDWDAEAMAAFHAVLADPPAPAPRAVAAMARPAPWKPA